MKLKRMVSVMAALAVSATTFAGMMVTANAASIKISENFENADESWDGLGIWGIDSGSRQTSHYISEHNDGKAFRFSAVDSKRSMNVATMENPVEGDMRISYEFCYGVSNSMAGKKNLSDVISFANSDKNVLFGLVASNSLAGEESNVLYIYSGGTLSTNTGDPTWGGDANRGNAVGIDGLTFNSGSWYSVDALIVDDKIEIGVQEINNQTNKGSAELDISSIKKDLKYSKFCIDAASSNGNWAYIDIDNINIKKLNIPTITLSSESGTVSENDITEFTVNVTCEETTETTVTSSEEEVAKATIDESGKVLVTGVSQGETTINVACKTLGDTADEVEIANAIYTIVVQKGETIPSAVSATFVQDYIDETAEDAATGASLWQALIEGTGTAYKAFDIAGTIKNAEGVVKTSNQQYDMGTTISTGDVYIYIAVNQAVSKLADGQTMELTVTPVSK